ncbi:flagellar hook-length control protein FliK [Burkholderia sp. BCCIQ04A]|uniref:Flagellar hook-length control protein FliK n=1 Tax=Burkholderia anthinoferrum TaxID=3090833 RepID=A0ABU5WZW3_9BURK|nr:MULTISPECIES: flagellar hook-length control protein FliK [Burkholderia]MEB2506470.1 flagellar hook-length control protein FliK [Burkholderia anthinoferrum]MEB2534198.1 flagellar hook-length control protein FliK [Burkholderia anthinoferrum]MEB2564417.1 flagellar hook-length control protein FliK [Burkholderia anthinoferrum]MEB2583818.1 flagellar hook-length control protein FliK [Burkholderia anthinoferrum]MCA8104203.1 flagellar hook-length control protein FliK [Burkholderia sp. AU36459]
MTESVSTPRSRSARSSARSRPRSAAAAGSTSAGATARSGSAAAGDASRDERTLDLFGDPVLEPGERMPVAVRDEAIAEADESAGADDGRQATLDGFSPPADAAAAGLGEAESAAAPDVATAVVSTPEGGLAANINGTSAEDRATEAVDLPAGDRVVTQVDVPVIDGAAKAETTLQAADGEAAQAAESQATDGEVAKPAVEAAVVKSREGKSSGDAVKERRASSGGKRRAATGTNEAAATQTVAVATSVGSKPESLESNLPPLAAAPVEPQTPAQPARPPEPAIAAHAPKPRDTAAQPDASSPPVTQPVASAASFVTKPSSERAQPAAPAFDPDTHLRPLTDRLAALQSDVDGLTGAADREMRRVNRLLLALAVVVLAALVALVLQTRQIAHLKQDVATKQQRIDRLAADLSTQQATLMTLEEHHEALLSQVDRLQRNANREAAVAKRVRRAR